MVPDEELFQNSVQTNFAKKFLEEQDYGQKHKYGQGSVPGGCCGDWWNTFRL